MFTPSVSYHNIIELAIKINVVFIVTTVQWYGASQVDDSYVALKCYSILYTITVGQCVLVCLAIFSTEGWTETHGVWLYING